MSGNMEEVRSSYVTGLAGSHVQGSWSRNKLERIIHCCAFLGPPPLPPKNVPTSTPPTASSPADDAGKKSSF